jgi:excisionase family DNA binding protein
MTVRTDQKRQWEIDRGAMSMAEAAQWAGVSVVSLYAEVNADRLKTARVGRRRVVPLEELRRWLAARTA